LKSVADERSGRGSGDGSDRHAAASVSGLIADNRPKARSHRSSNTGTDSGGLAWLRASE
jgi:hypothetical protein